MSDKPSGLHTIFYDEHLRLGAVMAPFGGFMMPIQYEGIVKEHEQTRRRVSVFDTCHMGEFKLQGPTAADELEALLTCRVATLQPGACRYGMLCNESGGVLDDLLVYRLSTDSFMLVVNAGTQQQDFAWILRHVSTAVTAENLSEKTAKIDIQGPDAPRLICRMFGDVIRSLPYFRFQYVEFDSHRILISRTGYTGEIGFEVYGAPAVVKTIWATCLETGAKPAGLGARDTLRLEAGLPLYGHELSPDRNAAAAGFARAIAADKTFIGSTHVQDPANCRERLTGLSLTGRRSARAGDSVLAPDGCAIGTITSGSFAPSLGHAVALAYVQQPLNTESSSLRIQTARGILEAKVVPLPFYRNGTVRDPIEKFL